MVKAAKQLLDFTKLLELEGVDGFVLFDPSGDVIQARLEDNSQILALRRALLANIESQRLLAKIQSQVLLTERGVINIISFEDSYLVVLAGHRDPVNVSKLTAITDALGMD